MYNLSSAVPPGLVGPQGTAGTSGTSGTAGSAPDDDQNVIANQVFS